MGSDDIIQTLFDEVMEEIEEEIEDAFGKVIVEKKLKKTVSKIQDAVKDEVLEVIKKKYSEDMSIKGIAQVMNKSRVSVKVLLYRARLRLAEKLQSGTAQGNPPRRGVASARQTASIAKVEGV